MASHNHTAAAIRTMAASRREMFKVRLFGRKRWTQEANGSWVRLSHYQGRDYLTNYKPRA